MTAEDKNRRYGPVVARVNSKSQPDVVYEVRQKLGTLSCNCKGWIFNRESPKRCRHTDAFACRKDELAAAVNGQYAEQRRLRIAAAKKRAGVEVDKDQAMILVEKILAVADLAILPGTRARMAAIVRPYLKVGEQQVVSVAPQRTNDLIEARPRCITLDD